MKQFIITYGENDTVVLEGVGDTEKKSIQMTQDEFSVILQYPTLSRTQVFNRLWKLADQTQGKNAVDNVINTAFEIMGRE